MTTRTVVPPFLWLLTLWAGCGGDGGPGETATRRGSAYGETVTIDSRIYRPYAPGYGFGVGWTLTAYVGPRAHRQAIATAPIGLDGSFRIVLPGDSAVTPHLEPWVPSDLNPPPGAGCSGSFDVSLPIYHLSGVGFVAREEGKSGKLSVFLEDSPGDGAVTSHGFVYVAEEVSITGRVTCPPESHQSAEREFDVHLARGWNTYCGRSEGTPDDHRSREFTAAIPPGLKWVAYPATGVL